MSNLKTTSFFKDSDFLSKNEAGSISENDKKLDELIWRCMDIAEELMRRRSVLDEVLGEGRMFLARASYSNAAASTGDCLLYAPTLDPLVRVIERRTDSKIEFDTQWLSVSSNSNSKSSSNENGCIELDNLSTVADPIKAFGSMAPTSLRSSQAFFHRAVDEIANIASLTLELDQLTNTYRSAKSLHDSNIRKTEEEEQKTKTLAEDSNCNEDLSEHEQ